MDTYEKKYKEALERAKKANKCEADDREPSTSICEYIFPELTESEDEKIRKSLIILLQHFCKGYRVPGLDFSVSYKDMLVWLEKQGEVVSDKDGIEAEEKDIRKAFNKIWEEKQDKQKSQRMISAEAKEAMYDKSADKVEPKFKVGDSIKTANEEPLTITEITDNGYWSEDLFICNFDDAAKWELVEQKPADKVEPKCEESKTKVFDAPTPFEDKLYAFVLACEILVDPSKREFILEHSQEILDAAREQIGKEQSSTWSEDDELVVEDIEEAVNYWYGQSQEDLLDWLKSLKTRYAWKPSDEQMATLYKYAEQNNYDGSILTSLYNDLKKLREDKL